MRGWLVGLAVFALAVVLTGAYLLSGAYDVSASDPEPGVVAATLHSTMERSVSLHSRGLEVSGLDDPALVREGFEHYDEMCVVCHAAPGVERSEISRGLNPGAPRLEREAPEWSPAELYWITKNGIKMSGMPGFGGTHDERELRAIVAFVRRLPQISAEEYRALREAAEAEEGEAGGHEHAGGPEAPEHTH